MDSSNLIKEIQENIGNQLGTEINSFSANSCYCEYNNRSINIDICDNIDFGFYLKHSDTDITIFSLRNKSKWEFCVTRTSVVEMCFEMYSYVGLNCIKPFCIYTNILGIKQALTVACNL